MKKLLIVLILIVSLTVFGCAGMSNTAARSSLRLPAAQMSQPSGT